MAGHTIKVSGRIRERICLLAEHEGCSQGAVIERALDCYERTLRAQEYLEGWRRFENESPEEFAEYLREAEALDSGLAETLDD